MDKNEIVNDIKKYVKEHVYNLKNIERDYMVALTYQYAYCKVCDLAFDREENNSYIKPSEVFNFNKAIEQAIDELEQEIDELRVSEQDYDEPEL